jgi:hypothetical protein
MPEVELGVLQRWMLSAVTTPGGVAEGVRVARDRYALDVVETIRGSDRLSAHDRLGIYARGYVLRLLECLRAEFPILRALVGDQVFEMFASSYVWTRPSRSPSLYDLGAGFAEFLQTTSPPAGRQPGAIEALPAELAALERARAESYRARGLENDHVHHATDAFTLMLSGAPLHMPESARLLALDFDFAGAIADFQRGERPAVPPAKRTCYAVARTHYRVNTHVLPRWQFEFLRACGSAGLPLYGACDAAASSTGRQTAELQAEFLLWLPAAFEAGLVTPKR